MLSTQKHTTLDLHGPVDYDGFLGALALTAEGNCDRNRWLIDTTDCELMLDPLDVLELSAKLGARPSLRERDVRLALVVDDVANNDIARMMVVYASEIGIDLALFKPADRDGALEYLAA